MLNMLPGGIAGNFAIFIFAGRFLPYLIGFLLAAVIVLWIFYGRDKTKGFLIAAIIVTVLFFIISAFNFLPAMASGIRGGKEMKFREFKRHEKNISSIENYHQGSSGNDVAVPGMFYIK